MLFQLSYSVSLSPTPKFHTQRSRGLEYGIPANPFLRHPGARPEVWAYGVRNIWRCGIDKGDFDTWKGRGRVICADVGQDK